MEGRDDLDVTAHQKMPVVEPGQDAVPPQSLEVTVSNMFIFPACCIADCVAKMSVVILLTLHGVGRCKSVNSFLYLHAQ